MSKTRHGTPSPLFKPVGLLGALALVVFLITCCAMGREKFNLKNSDKDALQCKSENIFA